MAVLIDTSVLIEVERGRATIADAIGGDDAAISVITESELLHGAHGWPVATTNVRDFARVPGLAVLPTRTDG